ncbi:4'-phosphopantetheinyl transferase superfamily protein [Aquimarina sp. RZ0]|uniref:4'-phosphopantetheinyl transferase family protein n=1 Tax=Aquimarina sp. RZ0 TaxID=2607730 RepID=UPI0011F2A86B|nr:4'-phosphopantetheinyl transferase family protein [Aquimarina sp. RZ0]KAA1246060.1 4'-phosphopantetheinyl transferase superfamily protein [Aquimarina sp. RZ0]
MYKGRVLLRREYNNFNAGFCIINKNLQEFIIDTNLLHPEEIEYYKTLRFERRKLSYLLGRVSAKKAILEFLINEKNGQHISIDFGVFKFPVVKYVKNQNVQVCISHCENVGVSLAFPEKHPLGIDIEKISEDKIKTMKSIISKEEQELISKISLSISVGYTLIWTIKEALSKILKTGLTVDFKLFEIKSLEKIDTKYITTFKYFTQYKSTSSHVNNFVCSVVSPKETKCNFDHLWKALENTINKGHIQQKI